MAEMDMIHIIMRYTPYMSGKWNVEWVGAVRALINPSLPQILAEVLSPASP